MDKQVFTTEKEIIRNYTCRTEFGVGRRPAIKTLGGRSAGSSGVGSSVVPAGEYGEYASYCCGVCCGGAYCGCADCGAGRSYGGELVVGDRDGECSVS